MRAKPHEFFDHTPIAQHFRPRRHLLSASAYRQEVSHRFGRWAKITGAKRAA